MNMDCLHQLTDIPVGVLLQASPATTSLREVQKDGERKTERMRPKRWKETEGMKRRRRRRREKKKEREKARGREKD